MESFAPLELDAAGLDPIENILILNAHIFLLLQKIQMTSNLYYNSTQT